MGLVQKQVGWWRQRGLVKAKCKRHNHLKMSSWNRQQCCTMAYGENVIMETSSKKFVPSNFRLKLEQKSWWTLKLSPLHSKGQRLGKETDAELPRSSGGRRHSTHPSHSLISFCIQPPHSFRQIIIFLFQDLKEHRSTRIWKICVIYHGAGIQEL